MPGNLHGKWNLKLARTLSAGLLSRSLRPCGPGFVSFSATFFSAAALSCCASPSSVRSSRPKTMPKHLLDDPQHAVDHTAYRSHGPAVALWHRDVLPSVECAAHPRPPSDILVIGHHERERPTTHPVLWKLLQNSFHWKRYLLQAVASRPLAARRVVGTTTTET